MLFLKKSTQKEIFLLNLPNISWPCGHCIDICWGLTCSADLFLLQPLSQPPSQVLSSFSLEMRTPYLKMSGQCSGSLGNGQAEPTFLLMDSWDLGAHNRKIWNLTHSHKERHGLTEQKEGCQMGLKRVSWSGKPRRSMGHGWWRLITISWRQNMCCLPRGSLLGLFQMPCLKN